MENPVDPKSPTLPSSNHPIPSPDARCPPTPRRPLLRWTIFVICDAALVLALWTAWMAMRVGPILPGPSVGNTPRSLELLPPRGPADAFRFAVISDIEEGVETFREALRSFAERNPDFVILNGDLAYRPWEEGARYFEWQFRDAVYPGPFFCNPGNHDLVNRRDVSVFRRHFGDDRFAFVHAGCQFLIVNNCLGGLSESDYAWIESAAAAAPAARHRFLFLHYPPLAVPKRADTAAPLPAYERLFTLAPRLNIRRVFSGNLHAYRRLDIRGVPYIVCGGGGADLHSPGAFHHYVEVTAEGDAVRDETIRLPSIDSPVEEIDRFAYVHVWPWLKAHPLTGGLIVAGALAGFVLQCRRGLKWRLAKRTLTLGH
jgi:hypothetical protein